MYGVLCENIVYLVKYHNIVLCCAINKKIEVRDLWTLDIFLSCLKLYLSPLYVTMFV